MVIAFLQHGLLFKPEYWLIGVLLYLGASAALIMGRLPSHPYFYVAVCLVGWYVLSTFYAINPQNAISASGKLALAIPFLILGAQLTHSYRVLLMRLLIYVSAGWVLIGGLLKQFREGRFEGTLEYANSWGALLLTALIMQISLTAISKNKMDYWISAILLIGILLTGSRTVFLIALILIPIQLFILKKNSLQPWLHKMQLRSLYLFAIPLITLICALAISRNLTWLNRFTSISPHASEWEARLGYYRDAWRIITGSPFVGYGGGSWNILQYQFQTAAYSVRYLHNFWLETWIDVGLIGVLMIVLLIFLTFRQAITQYKFVTSSDKAWILGCLLASCGLLIHSTVDFTFSYPLLFCLWVLLGQWTAISQPLETTDRTPRLTSHLSVRLSVVLIFITASFVSIRLGIAESLLIKADQRYAAQKNSKEAILLLEQSSNYALFPADQHDKLASLYLIRYLANKSSTTDIKRAEMEANQALAINPKDPHLLFLQTQIDYVIGNKVNAVERLRILQQQFPFRADIRDEYAKWTVR
ncbi:hypothetical protein GCM10008018_56790 [Paenibacillus marchantiophytorum]|uniref:O-antigen ligase-related domain-containing protein n=2 Tax=Paenibacillus marchantiophytorum TaxID=1619310 RepID=A0ABQ1F9I5_9BACL|nr:hypothetical protein GCM10008018_56790 [Paenibacillus marchantiophytorum]